MDLISGRIDYLPMNHRPVIRWPGNARLALWVSPNIEYYEFLPRKNPLRDAWPRTPHPDVQQYSYRDYGNRVGFWRMLEVIDHHQLRCTASLNLGVLELYPQIKEAMVQRDWAFMGHGIVNTQFLHGMSEDRERKWIRANQKLLYDHTGKTLLGLFGPNGSSTEVTSDLMAEEGMLYHCEYWHDDQPTPINVRSGKLISVPYSIEINDSPTINNGFGEIDRFCQSIRDQFDQLYAEGEDTGKVMCIGLHPYIIGKPHRIEAFNEVLTYILSHPLVWQTTADDIAQYFTDHYYEQFVNHAKILQDKYGLSEGSDQ
jgi:allantoinase